MQDLVTAALAIVALVLVLAGLAKLRRPTATGEALRAARLPGHPALVRVLGSVEVAVGVGALVVGGRLPALATASLYLGFTAFAAVQRRGAGASCGCFGARTTPLTVLHVVVDAVCAAVALAAAATAAPPLLAGGPDLATLTSLALVGCGAALVRLLLTTVPEWRQALALHPTRGPA